MIAQMPVSLPGMPGRMQGTWLELERSRQRWEDIRDLKIGGKIQWGTDTQNPARIWKGGRWSDSVNVLLNERTGAGLLLQLSENPEILTVRSGVWSEERTDDWVFQEFECRYYQPKL